MTTRYSIIALVTVVCATSSGCSKVLDPLGISELSESIDRAVSKFSEKSDDWKQQSREWQNTLNDLEKNFSKHNQELAQQFKHVGDHVVANMSGEVRADVDYLQDNIKSNLLQVSDALKEARAKMERERSDAKKKEILSDFLSQVAKKVWLDPTIISFVPHQIELQWQDGGTYTIKSPQAKTILAHGWGFDLPTGTAVEPIVSVKAGGNITTPEVVVSRSTNYVFQVTLDPNKSQLKRNDEKLIIRCGSRERELPITHIDPPPPVMITAIILTVHTPGSDESEHNDKDPQIFYNFSITDGTTPQGVGTVAAGKNETWSDSGKSGSSKDIRIPIESGKLRYDQRHRYHLGVHYNSTDGDPDHWCKFSAVAVLSSGGNPVEVLSLTSNSQFGHYTDHPERIDRAYPLNK